MNTWFNVNVSGMASLMAEDAGAPELRNPLNSAMRVNRNNKPAANPLRALKALVAAMFAM